MYNIAANIMTGRDFTSYCSERLDNLDDLSFLNSFEECLEEGIGSYFYFFSNLVFQNKNEMCVFKFYEKNTKTKTKTKKGGNILKDF